MLNQAQEETVLAKTRELCQAILDQPPVAEACQRLAVFMEDPQARSLYEGVVTRGQAMQEKQQSGQVPSPLELSEFETDRDQLLANPVARGFLDAQELMHGLHHKINKHVSKLFELGRVPTAEDFESACCGGPGDDCCGDEGRGRGEPGCGCKH